MDEITVIIPIFNEEKYIKNCLDSIIGSDFDKSKMEVLLIDGGSSDKTIEIIKEYQQKYPFFKLLCNTKKIAPVAMNIGIKNAYGKFLFIISAHAKYPKNYFSSLVRYCKELKADCVGPVLITETKRKTLTASAIKNVLSDPLGVGSAFRIGVNEIKEVDTVPFGCYRRDIFEKVGLYDERLVRNQDVELNKRIKRMGGKIYIVPEIECTYYARETFKDLAKNNFENGRWNILTAYYTKTFSSLSFYHFVPLLFVLSLFFSLIFSLVDKKFLLLFLAIFISYFIIILIRSWQIKQKTTLWHQITAFWVLHFSYGVGSLVGLIDVFKKIIRGNNG